MPAVEEDKKPAKRAVRKRTKAAPAAEAEVEKVEEVPAEADVAESQGKSNATT